MTELVSSSAMDTPRPGFVESTAHCTKAFHESSLTIVSSTIPEMYVRSAGGRQTQSENSREIVVQHRERGATWTLQVDGLARSCHMVCTSKISGKVDGQRPRGFTRSACWAQTSKKVRTLRTAGNFEDLGGENSRSWPTNDILRNCKRSSG